MEPLPTNMAAKLPVVVLCSFFVVLMLLPGMTSSRTFAVDHSDDGHVTGGGCVLRPDFHTPRVIPLWEAASRVQGCHIGQTTPNSQDVHVIHVKETQDEERDPPNVVTVHLRRGPDENPAPIVLILHCDYTVSWRLIGQKSDNQSQHRIYVTQGSQVIEVKDLKVTIRRRENENRIGRVVDWVKKRFKVMTSYSRLENANHVYMKLGPVEPSSRISACHVKTRSIAPNVVAFLQEPVPPSKRRGCVSNGTPLDSNTEVHVIKIDRPVAHLAPEWGFDHPRSQANDSGHVVPHVIITLQSRTGPRVDRDVVLVLRSREPVTWQLRAENVHGKIEILTENVVEVSRASSSSSLEKYLTVRTETLPEDSRTLVGLVADRYGLAFTFNEVLKANQIMVTFEATHHVLKTYMPTSTEEPPISNRHINPGTAARSVGSDPFLEDSLLSESFGATSFRGSKIISSKDLMQAHMDTIRLRDAGGRSGSGGPRAPPGTNSIVKSGAPLAANDVIRLPTVVLMDAITVECLQRHFQVSFPRLTLERLGIRGEDVSLEDTKCRPRNNETHIILAANFHRCGTVKNDMHNRVLYTNKVKFHFHNRKLGSSAADLNLMREAGIPVDDEDNSEGSGFPASTSRPEEATDMRSLEFQCDYLGTQDDPPDHDMHGGPPQRDFTMNSPDTSLYNMEVYRDEDFNEAVLPVDYPMTATEQDVVYVETRLDMGTPMRIVTENCWLSNNSDPLVTNGPRVGLLHNACPTSVSVKLDRMRSEIFGQMPNTPPPYDRFSFHLLSNFAHYGGLFIHCKLGVCSEDPSVIQNNVKVCVNPKEYCGLNRARPFHDHPVGSHHVILSRGPIHVLRRPPPPKPSYVGIRNEEEKGGDSQGIKEIKCTIPDQRPIFINGLSTEAVVGIAFAAFIIGTVLSAIMWCIYLRTDPLRATQAGQKRPIQHNSGYDLSANSGSSTPNSHSPITA